MNLTTISISTVVAPISAIVVAAVTTEQIVSVTQSILLIIAAVGVVAVNVIMARKVDKVKDEVQEVKAKADVIVGHVNSEKTAGLGREALLESKVVLLERMLNENKERAALLAQAVATAPAPVAAPVVSAAPLGTPEAPLEMHMSNTVSDPANVNQITKP